MWYMTWFASQRRQTAWGIATEVDDCGQLSVEDVFFWSNKWIRSHLVPAALQSLKTDLKKHVYFAHRSSFWSLWVRRAGTRVRPVWIDTDGWIWVSKKCTIRVPAQIVWDKQILSRKFFFKPLGRDTSTTQLEWPLNSTCTHVTQQSGVDVRCVWSACMFMHSEAKSVTGSERQKIYYVMCQCGFA